MPEAHLSTVSDQPLGVELSLSDLKIDGLEITDVREAVALPETGASSGSSSCGSSSCCGSCSCCAAC